MRSIAIVIAFVTGLVTSAFAQRPEIELVNAKWMELFNSGDFAGVVSLYTEDANRVPTRIGDGEGQSGYRSNVERHG